MSCACIVKNTQSSLDLILNDCKKKITFEVMHAARAVSSQFDALGEIPIAPPPVSISKY